VARAAAGRLGFNCWDQELMHAIAEHAHLPETMFQSLDEHRRDTISELISIFGPTHKPTMSDYMRELLRVIHTVSAHGSAIIVGRGAQYVLSAEEALRVRIVCPLEMRVHGLAQRNDMSESAARNEIERVEADRREFIRQNYHTDIADSSAYDLVINTGHLSVEVAADLLASAYWARFSLEE
jgi:cytidylate kinase